MLGDLPGTDVSEFTEKHMAPWGAFIKCGCCSCCFPFSAYIRELQSVEVWHHFSPIVKISTFYGISGVGLVPVMLFCSMLVHKI